MPRQNHLPHHLGILLSRQHRTGVNEVHGYEVLHPTLFLSPAFPGGLSLDSCIVDPSEAEHMSQMHYFCLLDERCLCLQQLALTLGWMHHANMNAYSEDLRKKIVEAKERGMPTVEVARTFGVGLSSVKRYAKTAREGGSLRPKRSPGRPPKADQRARRLLEADLQDRPAATLSERREYLRSVAGLRVSESTVSRLFEAYGVQ